MGQVRIKVCGLTRIDDVKGVVAAGTDAIGLVFYSPSPRAVTPANARELAMAAGPLVTIVGLFVDLPAAEVEDILAQVPIHLLQFHGDESPEYCQQFNRPYIKAIRMREGLDIEQEISRFGSAQGILLDAYRKGIPGGTGKTFDWGRVPQQGEKPIILAGGLSPDNVREAIACTQPYGLDVSGGVESAGGIKDLAKVVAFIANAKQENLSG